MTEANKVLLRRYIELYNDRAWDELRELLTADYVHHSNADELTADQFVGGAEWIIARIPDFRVEILDLIAEADRVAVRFVGRGTHAASMFGEAPSSRDVAWLGTTIFRIADDRIVEDWEVMDEGDLRRQIGAPAD